MRSVLWSLLLNSHNMNSYPMLSCSRNSAPQTRLRKVRINEKFDSFYLRTTWTSLLLNFVDFISLSEYPLSTLKYLLPAFPSLPFPFLLDRIQQQTDLNLHWTATERVSKRWCDTCRYSKDMFSIFSLEHVVAQTQNFQSELVIGQET